MSLQDCLACSLGLSVGQVFKFLLYVHVLTLARVLAASARITCCAVLSAMSQRSEQQTDGKADTWTDLRAASDAGA
jgi:hypothetical protein